MPSQREERAWRTRADPLAPVWDSEVVPLLEADAAHRVTLGRLDLDYLGAEVGRATALLGRATAGLCLTSARQAGTMSGQPDNHSADQSMLPSFCNEERNPCPSS
jgi:hypothetical protein